jgi:hypothetical protein
MPTADGKPSPVSASRDLGLHPASDFVVTTGAAAKGPIRQARWYFRDETVAVPRPGRPIAGFTPGVTVDDDLRGWAAARSESAPPDYPSLVWIAAPDALAGATLDADAARLASRDGALAFSLVARAPLNGSWFDDSSARFFAARTVKVRGTVAAGGIVARTLWPEDFRLAALPPLSPLPPGEPVAAALRARMRDMEHGGACAPFAAETLWRRDGTNDDLRGRAVIGFVVNGAQGDDDEAHAGHFALVTGRGQDDGAIGDWLAHNFYTLDSESEKGILAAPVPLDNYLADLNAGQAWYRPSYLLVAVLREPRAATLVGSALARVYNQFWRHQLVYHHPSRNCTSISVDALRALGWDVPGRRGRPRLLAALAFPWLALSERSVAKAMQSIDYAVQDPTRFLPAAAFEEIAASLLALAAEGRADGALGSMLARDLDALVYLRLPQLPSSRAWGDAPVVTLREYRARLPRDPRQLKIVPVPPRPFPAGLRDPDLLPPPTPWSEIVAAIWAVVSIVGIPWALRRWRRRAAGL